jgi:hypothetical protein
MATISHAESVIHSDWVYRWCFAPKGGVWQSRMVTTGSPEPRQRVGRPLGFGLLIFIRHRTRRIS